MSQGLDFDIKEVVVDNGTFGPKEISQLMSVIARDYSHFKILRDAVAELEAKTEHSPASNVRLGVCLYLLGRYARAIDILSKGDGGALHLFYLAKVMFSLAQIASSREEGFGELSGTACVTDRYAKAIENYEKARKAGYNADLCVLGQVEVHRESGDPETALKLLDNLSGAVEQTAEYLCQRAATVAALGGNPSEVVALYERAVDADHSHPGALFGLALENDRRGNDDDAMDLYKRAVAQFPTHVGALINLGVLYEDHEQYERAVACYQRVLDAFPMHNRANLFIKDARASGDMYYDEDAQKKRDRLSQVLNVPVTDFELSVRSRNCLRNMGIKTLGDLCRHSEQELLASKNFGETSLIEIKEMLAMKGLRLGQLSTEKHVTESVDMSELSADEKAMLEMSITDLGLSVRARKCLNRIGIQTVGELIRHTGDELLECKNFGVTSLNEVRERLTEHALQLRGE